MSEDDKDLREDGDDEKKGAHKTLDDSILDAFEGEVPVDEEDDTVKDHFASDEEDEEEEVPLDSGDYTLDEW